MARPAAESGQQCIRTEPCDTGFNDVLVHGFVCEMKIHSCTQHSQTFLKRQIDAVTDVGSSRMTSGGHSACSTAGRWLVQGRRR